jgi:voltage-gated potassium channel
MPLFHAHDLPPGTEVIARGAAGEAMFFVASGQVDFVSDVLTRSFHTGEYFGISAMIDNDVSFGTFRTAGRSRLLKLYAEDFRRLEHLAPQLGRQLRTDALQRVKERESAIAAHVASQLEADRPA